MTGYGLSRQRGARQQHAPLGSPASAAFPASSKKAKGGLRRGPAKAAHHWRPRPMSPDTRQPVQRGCRGWSGPPAQRRRGGKQQRHHVGDPRQGGRACSAAQHAPARRMRPGMLPNALTPSPLSTTLGALTSSGRESRYVPAGNSTTPPSSLAAATAACGGRGGAAAEG